MGNFWNWLENRIGEYEVARQRGVKAYDTRIKRMAAEYGIELQTTHPDEVAGMAGAGLEEDAFWLLATTPETDEKIRARADMILNRTTPAPNMVGG